MKKTFKVKTVLYLKELKKLLLIINIITAFLVVGITNSYANATYSPLTKISIKVMDTTIKDLFNEIESKTEFIFFYDVSAIDLNRKISLNVMDLPVDELLDLVFESTNNSYEFVDRQIVIMKKPAAKSPSAPVFKPLSPELEQPRTRIVTGTVNDENGLPILGASISVKGTTIGTISDMNGNFSLTLPLDARILVFSFVGMAKQEVIIENRTIINVVMTEESIGLEEVVAVGYGVQRKESVVGAISKTSQEVLEQRGGVTNLGVALSGQLPGVTVLQRVGQPGNEDPLIYIRGMNTWNDAEPLILVDGIERQMNDIDIAEVESVSVLKDASATAVFGVKGANGVILITTKRGKEGKPKLSLSSQYSLRGISKLYGQLDSYEGQLMKNEGVEREVVSNSNSWSFYMPYEQVKYYQKPQQYPEVFPNVDWADLMLREYAPNHKINLNLTGGTPFVKYFGSISYSHDGDIFDMPYNHERGYQPGFYYNRLNYRGNLDFNLSESTKLSINLNGYSGEQSNVDYMGVTKYYLYNALYRLSPDFAYWRYEDGYFGKNTGYLTTDNPYATLYTGGLNLDSRIFLGNDIHLTQLLDFVTKGLSVSAKVSYDHYINSSKRIDSGDHGNAMYKQFLPSIIDAKTKEDSINSTLYFGSGRNEFDNTLAPVEYGYERFSNADIDDLSRSLFYQLSLNYGRTFDKHDVTGLLLFNRMESTRGAVFPSYREDYVARVTYDYNKRYLLEINAAYNGSEKFGPKYRYGLFPSIALGWIISNERFMNFDWLNMLKIRYSLGKVGSDSGIPRWGYLDSWNFLNRGSRFGDPMVGTSPYLYYTEGTIANPNLRWETSIKQNIGLDLAVLSNKLRFEFDLFRDYRTDIFLNANQRTIPATFGANPVPGNIGETETKGFEASIGYRKSWVSGWSVHANFFMTKAVDKITKYEDAELLDNHLKREGFAINQTKTQMIDGVINNWDEIYASSSWENNIYKLPGDWDIKDFNGDGLINTFDAAPYGFPNRPQNTYSAVMGFGYKQFSFMMQLFGMSNSNIFIDLQIPHTTIQWGVSEPLRDYWTAENTSAFWRAPRLDTNVPNGDRLIYDASSLRLKTVELAYTLPEKVVAVFGIENVKIFANGNNVFFWSKLPTDIETGALDAGDGYPTGKHFNFGINIDF